MSLRRFIIRSNIQTHGLLWAVQYEERRFLRKGCSANRAISLAILIVTGRLV